ncbi:MAG: HAMP domain-containing sensor histidine kinase [Solirubrobacteraceae bacterium]
MRRRLVIAITAVTAAAVGLFALPLAVVLQRNYRSEELLRLQRDTVAAARKIDIGPSTDDPVEFPAGANRFAIYDRAGRRVAGEGADGPPTADGVTAEALRSGRPGVRSTAGSLVAAVPLLAGENVVGILRAARSDGVVVGRARRAWARLAGVAIALVVLAASAALLLSRRLAAPLERVAQAARRLGEGDFTVRAPPSAVQEVDAVADALNATATRLGDLVGRERAFSSAASHQLRTPLAALRLELEAMQLAGDAPGGVEVAIAQADRLQQTIETLLAVARDAPGRSDRTADLRAVLAQVQARWQGRLAHDGRPLHNRCDCIDDEAAVRAAPEIVGEILDVLVDNARRHGRGAVTITLRELDSWRAIDVEDEGDGVAAPESVFERRSSRTDGHGIGLALAHALAHAEGGRLTLADAGAHPRFTLLLPTRSEN